MLNSFGSQFEVDLKAAPTRFKPLLTQRADIRTRSYNLDLLNTTEIEYDVTVGNDVPCRVIMRGSVAGDDTLAQGLHQMLHDYRIVFPKDTEVPADCQVVVGSEEFNVVDVIDAATDKMFVSVSVTRNVV